ncbi:MAG: hypothetical protein ACFCD0_28635 [Gemmataceae bacterium]
MVLKLDTFDPSWFGPLGRSDALQRLDAYYLIDTNSVSVKGDEKFLSLTVTSAVDFDLLGKRLGVLVFFLAMQSTPAPMRFQLGLTQQFSNSGCRNRFDDPSGDDFVGQLRRRPRIYRPTRIVGFLASGGNNLRDLFGCELAG